MAVRCLNKEKDEKSATESNHDAIGQREGGMAQVRLGKMR